MIGIYHRVICPHTHEQNVMVEHCHRYIVKTGLLLKLGLLFLGNVTLPLNIGVMLLKVLFI
jgi:hypothetical protein